MHLPRKVYHLKVLPSCTVQKQLLHEIFLYFLNHSLPCLTAISGGVLLILILYCCKATSLQTQQLKCHTFISSHLLLVQSLAHLAGSSARLQARCWSHPKSEWIYGAPSCVSKPIIVALGPKALVSC